MRVCRHRYRPHGLEKASIGNQMESEQLTVVRALPLTPSDIVLVVLFGVGMVIVTKRVLRALKAKTAGSSAGKKSVL